MKLTPFAVVSFSLLLAAAATPALARGADPAFLSAGAPADAPEGYTAMCARDRELCDTSSGVGATVEASVDPAMPIAAIGRAQPAIPGASAMLDRQSSCAPMTPGWMTGLARDAFGASPIWAPPIAALGGAKDRLTPFFDPWLSLSSCNTAAAMPAGALAGTPIVATAAIDVSPQSPAPVQPEPASAQRATGLKLLRAVTRLANGNIRQRTDMELYGVGEYWNRPNLPGAGDCEDIAIEKRMLLIADGFDPSKLSYAVVYRHDIGLHVVLVARLDDGDFVLDSLSSRVRRWSTAPYTWLRMQTLGNPAAWTTVETHGA